MADVDSTEARSTEPDAPTGAYRSMITGEIVPQEVRIAAAKTRVSADKLRGVKTEQWIVDLATGGDNA